jgi:hypothetical protein
MYQIGVSKFDTLENSDTPKFTCQNLKRQKMFIFF